MLATVLSVIKAIAMIGGAIIAGIATWRARSAAMEDTYRPRRHQLAYDCRYDDGWTARRISHQQRSNDIRNRYYGRRYYDQPIQQPEYPVNQYGNQVMNTTPVYEEPVYVPPVQPMPQPAPSGQVMDAWDVSEREAVADLQKRTNPQPASSTPMLPAVIPTTPVVAAPVLTPAQEEFLCNPCGIGKDRSPTPVIPQLQTTPTSATVVGAINCHSMGYPTEALYDRSVFTNMQSQYVPIIAPPTPQYGPLAGGLTPNFDNDPLPDSFVPLPMLPQPPVIPMAQPYQFPISTEPQTMPAITTTPPALDPCKIADAINAQSQAALEQQQRVFHYGNI